MDAGEEIGYVYYLASNCRSSFTTLGEVYLQVSNTPSQQHRKSDCGAEPGPTQWGMERSEHQMERSGIQDDEKLQSDCVYGDFKFK